MVSGGPFYFDLFHGFTNVRERRRAGKAHAEILLVAGNDGHVALRPERLDLFELPGLKTITDLL